MGNLKHLFLFQNVILDSFWPQKDRLDFILINIVMLASFLTKNSRLGSKSYRWLVLDPEINFCFLFESKLPQMYSLEKLMFMFQRFFSTFLCCKRTFLNFFETNVVLTRFHPNCSIWVSIISLDFFLLS